MYPGGTVAAQVLGFVSAAEGGNEGLERVQNVTLTGVDGLETTELDARRRDIPQSLHLKQAPVNGKDIVLTIDSTIQQIAEEALGKMAQTYHPQHACAVVLDPKTGEVLALANYPLFDPNSTAKTEPGLWRNRAVADLYEPGSTLKLVTVAAALNEGISPHAIVTCCGRREKIKGGRLTCSVHPPFMAGHGPVDMYKIIQYSCNIGAAHLAMRMGAEKLYSYEKAFGLLDRTDAGFGCEAVGLHASGGQVAADQAGERRVRAGNQCHPASDGGGLRDDRQRRGLRGAEGHTRSVESRWYRGPQVQAGQIEAGRIA